VLTHIGVTSAEFRDTIFAWNLAKPNVFRYDSDLCINAIDDNSDGCVECTPTACEDHEFYFAGVCEDYDSTDNGYSKTLLYSKLNFENF